MKFIRILLVLFIVVYFMTSCIALRKDVDMAKSQITAENNAKIKVLEDNFKKEIGKISSRLDEIEKTLQIDKKAAENKISLSFSTLDELKSTIREINNRIDNVDVTAQQGGGVALKVAEIEKALKIYEEEMAKLRKEVFDQIDEMKPVENLTVTQGGKIGRAHV